MSFLGKLKHQLYLVPVLAALPFYGEFGRGVVGILRFFGYFLLFILQVTLRQPDGQMLRKAFASLNSKDVLFFFMGGIAYIVLYRSCLFILAQFALPVTEWADRKKAANRLLLFTQGRHGPAIFVKGGQKTSRQGELDSAKPGVALVDSSSAVALVQHDDVKAMSLPSEDEWQTSHVKPLKKGKSGYEPKEPEIKGPGVVFTEKGQKIDDTVDLRKQTRTSDLIEVYTRTGIKINSKVSVVFSLSEAPETLLVGYLNGKQPTDLRILKVSQNETDLTVKGGVDIDMEDALEILRVHQPSAEVPPANPRVPYPFDPERVKWAVFNQARDGEGKLVPWHRAPIESAIDIFRRMMSDVSYERFFSDDLLNFNRRASEEESKKKKQTPQDFIAGLKEDFALRVKARGMMTFQFVEHLNGEPFVPSQVVRLDALRRQPPITLTREKHNFFRHMGIVVKSASFGEVQASDSGVQKKMLAAWKARVERDIATVNAEYELEAIRTRNRNRALAQEEMTHLLAEVFQSTPHFDEALALRILQALETAVADREIPPADLNELLKNIHDWLLPDQKPDKGDENAVPQPAN